MSVRSGSGASGGAGATVPRLQNDQIESTEPWSFNGKPGEILRTPHYRVYITDTRATTLERLPLFMETALAHYRVLLTGSETPLPYPDMRMDTFILDTRPDWELLTKQLLGEQAAPFLKIRRGGFAYAGRALLFDIGTRDTLSVAAHEGWHQYTQRTFHQPLPIWLEEGIATLMEGHRWAGAKGGEPVFLPWVNVERFDQLRRAEAQHRLMPLFDLLKSSPQTLMNSSDAEPALVYYAQVWALSHFLNEGCGGKYRAGLQSLLHDAAAGRVAQTVVNVLGPQAAKASGSAVRGLMTINVGPGVFLTYFNLNLAEADREYQAFIKQLVQPGSRGAIVEGLSPFASVPAASGRSGAGSDGSP